MDSLHTLYTIRICRLDCTCSIQQTAIFYCSVCLLAPGELPLEDLLAMYNLQRQSATPETDVEEPSEGSHDSLVNYYVQLMLLSVCILVVVVTFTLVF